MSQLRGVAPIVWFTGLSGAGKTTLSEEVARRLEALGMASTLLDGGDMRRLLFPELGFSPAERNENVRRLGVIANLLATQGVVALVAAMSPDRHSRDAVRATATRFIEVFVDAPIAACEERDPVGLYRRFHAGEIAHVSGLDEPYEKPHHPEVHCRTAEEAVHVCAQRVVQAILGSIGRRESL